MSDIVIELTQHGPMYWISQGEAIHVPTGMIVEFEECWNNRGNRRRAIAELQTAIHDRSPDDDCA